jgi:hypothetical protein
MSSKILIQVETTGESRTVTSTKNPASPRTFYILSAYALLPGVKYPQAIELFISDPSHLKPAGNYLVPVNASVKDNRVHFELDFGLAQVAQSKQAAA